MGAPRKRQTNLRRDQHEETILQHLYDEGPTTIEGIQELLGLSRPRVAVILTHMRVSGSVGQSYLRDGVSYWLLAEDCEDA